MVDFLDNVLERDAFGCKGTGDFGGERRGIGDASAVAGVAAVPGESNSFVFLGVALMLMLSSKSSFLVMIGSIPPSNFSED
jgi:hypothetical protein